MEQDKIHIIIADDMEAHIRRISRIIEQEDDLHLDTTAASGKEVIEKAAEFMPDIILMDIEMEDQDAGIKAAKEINRNYPYIKIIMLTSHDSSTLISAAFQTGIVDYILKTLPTTEIITGIREAYHNRSPIRPIIADKLRHEFVQSKEKEASLLYLLNLMSDLTTSEIEILQMLCKGMTRREICEHRTVEVATIKKQINSILKKCQYKRTKDLVKALEEMKILQIFTKL